MHKRNKRARALHLAPGAKITSTVTAPAPRARLLEDTSAARKRFPVTTGFMDYFPDAVAAVAEISFLGNLKHNPGEPLHWARGKSMDHADCIGRHLVERGGYEIIEIAGVKYKMRHTAAMAWRSMALLQEELEAEHGLDEPRGAKAG